jgi:hypothetical protein
MTIQELLMSEQESNLLDDVRVSLANLTTESHERVLEAVATAEAAGTTDQLDVREVVQDAEAVDYHRAQADEYQQLQAKAASAGNWDEAREYAAKAAGELESVADHGGSDLPAAEAQQDVAQLDNAKWQQQQANENARAASSYAEVGDMDAAQVYASEAGRHQVLADESGYDGIAGAREAQAESGGLHEDSAHTPEHAPDESATTATAAPEHDATPDVSAATPDHSSDG